MTNNTPNYKDNLLEQVGGQSQFDFIVITYCENIQDDHVNVFFADMDLYGLIDLQKEFLNAALLDLSVEETEAAMGRLAVKYQKLWQMGLNEQYFDALKGHFIEALRDCWVQENLVAVFNQHYETLRPLFQQTQTHNGGTSNHHHHKEQTSTMRSPAVQRKIHSRLGGVTHAGGSRRI